MNFIIDNIVKWAVDNDPRVDYPIFFQQEASDIAILIYRCHWYIWVYLTFILVFVLCMFFFIILDASKVRYVSSIEDLYFRHLYLKWSKVEHLSRVEFIWTVLPCIFLMLMGVRSIATLYLIDAPLNVFAVIKAYGRQWYWQFEVNETRSNLLLSKYDIVDFDLDKFTINKTETKEVELTETFVGTVSFFDSYMLNLEESDEEKYLLGEGALIRNLSVDVPLSVYMGLPLRFLTTAMDVLHSFAVPSLGIKMDAVPGRLNSCDVVIEREGIYYGQCSELCGQGHGFMPVSLYSCVPVAEIENPFDKEIKNPVDTRFKYLSTTVQEGLAKFNFNDDDIIFTDELIDYILVEIILPALLEDVNFKNMTDKERFDFLIDLVIEVYDLKN